MGNNKTAVAIISFNRPHYLRPVLESIAKQTTFSDYDYFLFQDGAVNTFSNERHAKDEDIDESCRLAESIIPGIKIERSVDNIGIYLNFRRAEQYLFKECDYSRIYFFEDDFLIRNDYFETLKCMMDAYEGMPIAEVSAIGNHAASVEAQKKNLDKLVVGLHHWAYGLYKDKWEIRENNKHMKWYHDMVSEVDYTKRPGKEIIKYYEDNGIVMRGSSQDGAKDVVYAFENLGRVSTYAVNGMYIGAEGIHTKQKWFEENGFSNAVLYPDSAEVRAKLNRGPKYIQNQVSIYVSCFIKK